MRSSLEIFDMHSGSTRVVLQSEELLEAPNWHPFDDKLLINGGGRLFWVDLDGGKLTLVDTGDETQCNNDHGISPDGKWIAFSGKAIAGEACIFRVPVKGGAITRLSQKTPSYWHGWSPDGARHSYCARRDGLYQIATCAADGSDEVILTHDECHHDGPDFSPDGAWIWYNSDADGPADLYRMRPDGSDRQKMTEDARVNWFPHPSPNGQHVLYLSYPDGTLFHPRDLYVELRRINPDGTGKETLLKLFGGQGTINVPCWSPDGSKFAFMRYAPEMGRRV